MSGPLKGVGLWSRFKSFVGVSNTAQLGWKLATAAPVGYGVAAFTPTDLPPEAISPGLHAVLATLSAAGAVYGYRAGAYVMMAGHLANEGVQLYNLGLWGSRQSRTNLYPRTRVVVLGSGWGSMSFIKELNPKLTKEGAWYDLTVISPRNFFLYTPLLPGAISGTVEPRSIVQPVRSLLEGRGNFYEAEALNIDTERKVIQCKYSKSLKNIENVDHQFEVPYDVLVFAVGAINNTFNTPGVEENAFFLKEIKDANVLRHRINECFEIASLPDTSEEKRRELLSFVVVGGGPTGVESAAEIHDMVLDDMLAFFPKLKDDVRIMLVETRDHILSMYDRKISDYTSEHFARQGIQLLLNNMVKSVDKDGLVLEDVATKEKRKVTAGTTIWCTGIKLNPLATQLLSKLPPGSQENARAIKTDWNLRVKGSGGSIFALGDTATIEQTKAIERAAELFEQGDTNKNGLLSCAEIRDLMKKVVHDYPQLAEHERYFDCKDQGLASFTRALQESTPWLPWLRGPKPAETLLAEPSQQEELAKAPAVPLAKSEDSQLEITLDQFKEQLARIDKTLRFLPATAQVASQEGRYLASLFNRYHVGATVPNTLGGLPVNAPPFRYNHLGSFAYVGGDSAVLEAPAEHDAKPSVFTGWMTGLLWKSSETWMQFSWRNKYLVSRDWLRSKLFGRDISDVGQ